MGLSASAEGVSVGRRVRSVGWGRAHAKAIVLGEHAVVYGAPAVALPIPQLAVTASIGWSPGGGPDAGGGCAEVSFTATGLRSSGVAGGAFEGLRELVGRFSGVYGVSEGGRLDVVVDGGVPHGRGLGSSAAYARAVVVALADLYGLVLSDDEVFDLVQTAENVAHGRSSGVDARAVGAAGPLWFCGGRVEEVVVGGEGLFIVADSGQVGRTKDAVGSLREGFGRRPGAQEVFVQAATDLTVRAREALAAGRVVELGGCLTQYHGLLRGAGLSTDRIDALVSAALAGGSLGAKITGGGLGGCVIALTHPAQAPAVTARLNEAGAAQTWAVPLRGTPTHAH